MNAAADDLREALRSVRQALRVRDCAEAANAIRGWRLKLPGHPYEFLSCGIRAAVASAGLAGDPAAELAIWLGAHADDATLDTPPPSFRALEPISTVAGTLTAQVDTAEAAMIEAGFNVYNHAGSLVRLGHTRDGVRVGPVDEHHLAELFGQAATWLRFDARKQESVVTSAPREVARTYLSRGPMYWRVPPLTGIINGPTLRADGSLLSAPGYDADTGLYLDESAGCAVSIPAEPDEYHAWDAALLLFNDLLAEFPFVSDQDDAVAMAAILTAAVRRSLPTAPLFGFTAPAPGTGKSLLMDVVAMIATGRPAPALTWSGDPAEDRKQLDSALLAGASIIALDNVTAPLGGDRLNQLLTQGSATVRPLGRSELIEVPCQAAVLANGNNLTLAADMTRRGLLCRLDAAMERPELRAFNADPLALIRANRGKYLGAALTVLLAYDAAGRPGKPAPFGSFDAWSNLIRGAVMWVGFPDPVGSVDVVRANDPARAALAAVLHGWDSVIGPRPVTSREIIDAATRSPEFREALLTVAGVAGAVNTQRLGTWLSSVKGSIVDGLVLHPATLLHGNRRWELQGGTIAANVVTPIRPLDEVAP